MSVNLKQKWIPRLSRTLNFNFQDFPGPNSFSRTFWVLKILEKSQDFPGGMGTLARCKERCSPTSTNCWLKAFSQIGRYNARKRQTTDYRGPNLHVQFPPQPILYFNH